MPSLTAAPRQARPLQRNTLVVAHGEKIRTVGNSFLPEIESSLSRGSYVDPHAGRTRFGDYASRWLASRSTEATTAARDASVMRNHVLARWGTTPIGKIDHLKVQAWVSQLAERLSPA